MEFKKLMGVLTIAVTVIVVALLAFSLAWYSFSNGQTSFETSTGSGNVSVIFAQSQYINTTTGVPISSSDVDTKADKTIFTVSSDATALAGYTLATQISLVDINLDSALRVSDFHYQLLQTVNGTTTTVASGTGVTIGSNTELVLKSMSTVTVGATYTYELRVWLQDSGVSQNDLMQKNFSARVQVSSAAKK